MYTIHVRGCRGHEDCITIINDNQCAHNTTISLLLYTTEVTAGDEHSKFAAQRSLKQELEQLETLWDMWQSVIERGAQW